MSIQKKTNRIQRFLGVLRNSIHSVGLHGLGVSRAGEQESSLGRVFEGDKDIWEAGRCTWLMRRYRCHKIQSGIGGSGRAIYVCRPAL